MTSLLKPLELAYRGVAAARRRLYRAGMLKSKRLPRPVVSIGNIAFGGTGKTPVVIAVASELIRRGYRVAVLTRGYGRTGTGSGDEPLVIARSAPPAEVIVNPDRHAAGLQYLRERDCDVFLLDDGFQHLQLDRDLDIVIDHPSATLLRESRAALRDADLILVRDGLGDDRFLLELAPTRAVVDGREQPVGSLRGMKAVLFSGLADNRQFFEMCRRLGVEVLATHPFRDHHRYSESEVEQLRAEASRTGALLLTTEKDVVKTGEGGIAYLRVEARITPRDPFFDRIVQGIGLR